jgi:hypothetical protein
MAVSMGDVAFVLDVSALATELTLMQEVAESHIVILTPTPLAECFALCGLLPPWIFEDVHPFKSNSMGQVCTAAKPTAYV